VWWDCCLSFVEGQTGLETDLQVLGI
jgi:hypothetical protein